MKLILRIKISVTENLKNNLKNKISCLLLIFRNYLKLILLRRSAWDQNGFMHGSNLIPTKSVKIYLKWKKCAKFTLWIIIQIFISKNFFQKFWLFKKELNKNFKATFQEPLRSLTCLLILYRNIKEYLWLYKNILIFFCKAESATVCLLIMFTTQHPNTRYWHTINKKKEEL